MSRSSAGRQERGDERVVLYGTRWCGYCRAAEALLEERGISFQRIDVRGDPDMRRWLRETTQRHTVPQIFIDGRPIGGYAALARLDSSGELEALLDRPDARAGSAGE